MAPDDVRRGTRWQPCLAASPILRQLMAEMVAQGTRHADIADFIGVDKLAISNWRRGKHEPSLLYVEKLATALGYKLTLEKL